MPVVRVSGGCPFAWRALRVSGYFVAAAPPALDPEHFPGFRQFYVLGPQTGRDHVRAVWVGEEEDVGRWHFGTDIRYPTVMKIPNRL